MDRELTSDERKKAMRKKMLPYIIGVAVVVVIIAILMITLRSSVNRDDLLIATVDTGTIETTVTGSGSVVIRDLRR